MIKLLEDNEVKYVEPTQLERLKILTHNAYSFFITKLNSQTGFAEFMNALDSQNSTSKKWSRQDIYAYFDTESIDANYETGINFINDLIKQLDSVTFTEF